MKLNQTHGPSKLKVYGLIAAGLMLGLTQISAWAAVSIGTPSGTTISNLATLNYTVGGVAQTAIGSTQAGNLAGAGTATTFLVDSKVNLTVAESKGTYTSVVPGQGGAGAITATSPFTTFTVTNTSNTTLDFNLAAANLAGGQVLFSGSGNTGIDNFDGLSCATYVDTNGDGTYTFGTDTAISFIDELASGDSKTIFVVCNIPIAQINGDNAIVSLTATALGTFTGPNGAYVTTPGTPGAAITKTVGAQANGTIDQVFADVAGTDDIVGDAKHSARGEFHVTTAVLNVAKTVTPVCDPANGNTNPKEIPGGVVRWTITITNTGGASATLGTIADTLDSNTTFDPDLITGVGAVVAGVAAGCEFAAGGAGIPENAVAKGFKLANSTNRPFGGTAAGAIAASAFFTTASDADGAELTTATSVTFNLATAMPAGGTYTAGELKTGETLTIYFNVGVK